MSFTALDKVKIDDVSKALSLIDSGHHEVHAERAYWASTENAAVAATGTLTFDDNVLNTKTVTLGAKTYTFQDALTNVDGNVQVGASASESIDNLIAAMGLKSGAGTDYAAAMTLHANCTGAPGAGDTMVATAMAPGTAGNAIVSTETINGSWATATLVGGLEADRLLTLALKTPNITTRFHLTAEFISEDKAHFEVYEGRTWTTSTGSQVSVLNRHRGSSNTTAVLEDTTGAFADNHAIVKNPTTLAAGTLLYSERTWVNKNDSPRINVMDEIVLNADTTYSFELTSDAGLKSAYIRLRWYEKVDGS